MSFAGYLIVLVLIVGALVGMYAVAASTTNIPIGTYGDAPTIQSNNTMGAINSSYIPIAGLGVGVMFIIALFLMFAAVGFALRAGGLSSGPR
jgi:hypothetical protein